MFKLTCPKCETTDIIPGSTFLMGDFERCPECNNLVKPPVLSFKESEVRDQITVRQFDQLRLYRTLVVPEGRIYVYRNRFDDDTKSLMELGVWEPCTRDATYKYQLTPLGLLVLHDLSSQTKQRRVSTTNVKISGFNHTEEGERSTEAAKATVSLCKDLQEMEDVLKGPRKFLRAEDNRPMYCRQCFEGRVMIRLLNPLKPHPDMEEEENKDVEDFPATYWCHICETYDLGLSLEIITAVLKDFEDCGGYKRNHQWDKEEEPLFISMPRMGAI